LAEAIKQGRTVIASRSGADPDLPETRYHYPQMPPGYAANMRANLETIASFGVHLPTAQDLRQCYQETLGLKPTPALSGPSAPATAHTVSPVAGPLTAGATRDIVSHQTVAALARGSQLRVSGSAIITALAADTARRRGIEIVRNERG
jgi:hypothetical protein